MSKEKIKELIETPYHILLERIYKDEKLLQVYNKNKTRVYNEKVKVDFDCIKSAEDIYLITKGSPEAYERLSKRKAVLRIGDRDVEEYFNKSMIQLYEGDILMTRYESIPFAIAIFTEIYNYLMESKNKGIVDSLTSSFWEELTNGLVLFEQIFNRTRNENTYPHYIKIVDRFFDEIGDELLRMSRRKLGIRDLETLIDIDTISDNVYNTFYARSRPIESDEFEP